MRTKLLDWLMLWGVLAALLALPQSGLAGGACTCARFNDWKALGCRMSPGSAGAPGSAASQSGGNQANCPTCPPPDGMPRWWVDEPYENLFITDEPLSYFLSSGQRMVFRWHYKQRYQLPQPDECPNLYNVAGYTSTTRPSEDYAYLRYQRSYGMTNGGWGHNWLMDVTFWDQPWEVTKGVWNGQHLNYTVTVFSQEYEALVFRPEGGMYYFANSSAAPSSLTDPVSQAKMQARSGLGYPVATNAPTHDAGNIYWGDPGTGLVITYADGSQDVFGLAIYDLSFTFTTSQPNSTAHAFLTQRIDPQGRVTQLGYEAVSFQDLSVYRLRYVVDIDGRTNTFLYDGSAPQPWAVSEIDDPYGRSALFGYGSNAFTNGLLTSITDAATNTSTLAYQGISGWITNLTTPYGTTSFSHYQVADPSVINGFSQRAVCVSEPGSAYQLFYYLHQTNAVPATATAPTVPGRAFDDGNTGANHPSLSYRNTFHWDRRQFAALSSSAATWLPFNLGVGLTFLSAADFNKAGLKHWLWATDGISLSGSLSSEREPSVDAAGQVTGARTWYSYPGKPSPEVEGAPQLWCVARQLPDGTSQYVTYDYYYYDYPGGPANAPWGGLVQFSRSSYSQPDGTTGELTNWFNYVNGIDLVSATNSLGQFINFGYNAYHQATSITEPLNQVTQLGYDASTHNLSSLTLPSGLAATLSYYPSNASSPNGALLQTLSWSPIGRSLTFTWTNGLPLTVQDDLGLHLTNFWDGLNRRTGTAFPDSTTTSNIYNLLHVGATQDRLGRWTSYGYDPLEHLTSITDARSNVTQFGWCDCGALSSITDPLTNPTAFFYNNQGLLTNIVFADNSSVTYTLDSIGRVTGVADGLGKALMFGYDNQGLVTVVSNAYGLLESVVYDAVNRPIQVTDANKITVTNQFDLLDRLIARSWPDGVGEGFGWATNGLVAYTNRDQKVTWFTRDGAGRLTTVTNANQEVTQFGYNSLGEVTDLWDGRTNHSVWHYDQYGWLSNKVDALGHEVLCLARNANGWITNRWTPQFGNTGYGRDPNGNILTIAYPQSTVSFTRDPLNRVHTMLDALGTTTFGYTAAGQLQSATGPWTSDTVSYGYSQQLRQTLTLAQPSGGNWQQTYVPDNAWRLQSVSSPAGGFGYGFGAANPASALVRTLTLPNAASITNHYDSLARLDYTALVNYWGHVLDGYSYGMDPLGLRTNITRNLGLTTNTVGVGFDNIGQITSWSAKEGLSGPLRLNEQYNYTYDKAGNLWLRTNGSLAQTFNCDSLNQLTNVSRNSVMTVSGATPAPATNITANGQPAQTYGDFTFAATNLSLANGANTFTIIAQNAYGLRVTNTTLCNLPSSVSLAWDANGNLTNDGSLSFAYSPENQLTNVTVAGAWKTDFVFDGLGRRRVELDYGWQSGNWTKTNELHFIYDGWLLVQVRDGSNNVLVTYTRGLDLSGSLAGAGGIGGLLARSDQAGSTFYHADGAGNITGLMDGQQNMAERLMFDPFGKPVNQQGPMAGVDIVGFSSMPQAHGIVFYLGRHYLTIPQRWGSRDPIGERGGINLYGFVGNNPINRIDPYGEDAVTIGPVTIPIPFTTKWWEEDLQSAHEGQHRSDWLNGNPGWLKEQRGFAAEIPVIQEQIGRFQGLLGWMRSRQCRDEKAEQNLEQAIRGLNTELQVAESIANSDQAAMDYWNSAVKRWYQSPASPIPPPQPVNAPDFPGPFRGGAGRRGPL